MLEQTRSYLPPTLNREFSYSAGFRVVGSWLPAGSDNCCGFVPSPVNLLFTSKVAQRKLQSAKLWMLILIEAKGDIESLSGEQLRLLNPFGEVPTERIEADRFPPVLRLSRFVMAAERG